MTNPLKKLLKFLTIGAIVVPYSVTKMASPSLPATNGNGQKSPKQKEEEGIRLTDEASFKLIFADLKNIEYSSYILNNSGSQLELGIHPDGKRNMLTKSSQAGKNVSSIFIEDPSLKKILPLFRPGLSESEHIEYLKNYPILVGQDIDYYLENIRRGSWGTTVMSVDSEGKVHFDSISLRTLLVEPGYTKTDELRKLISEEFFQAHQYDTVLGDLYNNGYLANTAQINSPESLAKEISEGNLRAFLELFPQQKYLTDTTLGANSYNFYIGSRLFSGAPSKTETVNQAYEHLSNFVEKDLGVPVQMADFLDPSQIKLINDKFRQKYLDYYKQLGIPENQIQIWNVVGMKRYNRSNPDNSLDIPATIHLPGEDKLAFNY